MERPVNTTIPAQIKFLLFQAKKSVLCLVSILELPTWGGCIRPLGSSCFSSSSSLRSSSTKRFHETSPQSFPVCQNIIRGYCGTLQYGYFRKVRWICVFHKNILEKCVPKIGVCMISKDIHCCFQLTVGEWASLVEINSRLFMQKLWIGKTTFQQACMKIMLEIT